MFKKFFLVIMLAASVVFSYGMAQAGSGNPTPGNVPANIDGLVSGVNSIAPDISVYLNPGGMGDALIYGYYNARGAYNFLRVVNTSSHYGVSAKVRIREGKNSNELLDFYICLSAKDQWTGWIIGADDNGATPAYLLWYDSDTPTFPDPNGTGVGDDDATNNGGASKDLRYSATGGASSVTADDTKEGYFEIVGLNAWEDTPGGSKVIDTPHKCGRIVLDDWSGSNEWTALHLTDPTIPEVIFDAPNTLFGNNYIFDVKTAPKTFAYNAVAVANFKFTNGAFPDGSSNADIVLKGSLGIDSYPTFADAEDGLEALNYVLTKTREYATYDIEAWWTGNTTIINTFPTKMLSIREDQAAGTFFNNSLPNGPFNDLATYNDPRTTPPGDGLVVTAADRCDEIFVVIYDDAEHSPSNAPCDFSPCTPTSVTYTKCDEVSLFVVGTGKEAPVTSTLVNGNLDVTTYTIGWLYEDFSRDGAGALVPTRRSRVSEGQRNYYRYAFGMPVISYELQTFVSGYLNHMLPLRYETDICGVDKQCLGQIFNQNY